MVNIVESIDFQFQSAAFLTKPETSHLNTVNTPRLSECAFLLLTVGNDYYGCNYILTNPSQTVISEVASSNADQELISVFLKTQGLNNQIHIFTAFLDRSQSLAAQTTTIKHCQSYLHLELHKGRGKRFCYAANFTIIIRL